MVGWIIKKLGVQLCLAPGHTVLDGGPAAPPPKGHSPHPLFGPYLLWPNNWTDQDATWYGGRPRPKRHCARWGPSSPPQKGGRAPKFLAHVYCGQTAGWIKMPLDVEVGLGPGHIVLDGELGTQLPTERGTVAPQFRGFLDTGFCRQACIHINRGPCLLWPNGWMDQDTTWYGGRPCVRCGASSPHGKGHSSPCLPFSAHICYGQMARWFKMPLGREVGLGPSDTVRWGPSSPSSSLSLGLLLPSVL